MMAMGIDIAKAKFDVVLLNTDGKKLHRVFDNTPHGFHQFKRWLSRHKAKGTPACMEATGYYYLPLADFLHQANYPVHVVNPNRISAYAKSKLSRNKTDPLDAALIADFCLTQQPPLWTPPTPTERELLALTRRYDDLKETIQAERNRLESGIPSETVLQDIRQHIAFLEKQLTQMKAKLVAFVDQHPHLKQQADLLQSIPGIGALTAARLLAELPDWRRFDSARQVVAFAGLNPQHHDSGRYRRTYTPISKQGSVKLRTALYMPALVAMRCNPILETFAERLATRGVTGKKRVVAVMRKLLHIVYGVLKSGKPFDPHYHDKLQLSA